MTTDAQQLFLFATHPRSPNFRRGEMFEMVLEAGHQRTVHAEHDHAGLSAKLTARLALGSKSGQIQNHELLSGKLLNTITPAPVELPAKDVAAK